MDYVRTMVKKLGIGFLVVGGIAMLVMSFHYFQGENSGILKRKDVAASLWYIITFRAHVLFGLIAILVGPVQFVKHFRSKHIRLHRRLGYAYFLSVMLSSLAGLIIAQYAMGGGIANIGFTLLSFLWFAITIKSVLAILGNNPEGHKKWAFFGYSLTFAAITQRTLLLVPLLSNVPFLPIYQLSAWLPWMLNLSIAYLLLKSPFHRNINRIGS